MVNQETRFFWPNCHGSSDLAWIGQIPLAEEMKFTFHCCGSVLNKVIKSRIQKCVPCAKYFKLSAGIRNYFATNAVCLGKKKQIKHENSRNYLSDKDLAVQHKTSLTFLLQNYLHGNLKCGIYMQKRRLSSSTDSTSQLVKTFVFNLSILSEIDFDVYIQDIFYDNCSQFQRGISLDILIDII